VCTACAIADDTANTATKRTKSIRFIIFNNLGIYLSTNIRKLCRNSPLFRIFVVQIFLIIAYDKNITACFTGHRSYRGECKDALLDAVRALYKEGYRTFLCGMAVGFDLLAAEIVLALKKKNPHIKLIACIPCIGQEKYFSKTDQKRYVEAVAKADEQVILADAYYRGCMQARDKYMADRGDIMVAYCTKKEGGAAYTVRCFEKAHPEAEIIFI
jgi:uncharacterized phage-like protein YoqJ